MHTIFRFLIATGAIVASGLAVAANIIVDTYDGGATSDGSCSLAEAIEAANTNASVDSCAAGENAVQDGIVITGSGTIALEQELFVTQSLVIVGSTPQAVQISGQMERRMITVAMDEDDAFVLSGVTIRDARATNFPQAQFGAAIRLVQGGEFRFVDVHFINNAAETNSGGAIFAGPLLDNPNATLSVERCLFDSNLAADGGGAIASFDVDSVVAAAKPLKTVEIIASEFIGNQALNQSYGGGALYFSEVDTVVIRQSQFIENSAVNGGAILTRGPFLGSSNNTLVLDATSIIANEAADSSGALYATRTDAVMINNTVFGNAVTEDNQNATAISFLDQSTATLQYNTIHNNTGVNPFSPSLHFCADCVVSMRSSIVWTDFEDDLECRIEGPMGAQPGADFTSLGFNIDGSATCASGGSDYPESNPLLLPLEHYDDNVDGIALLTLLPSESSPAIDSADSGTCPSVLGTNLNVDQRDFSRPRGGVIRGGIIRGLPAICDVGAVERHAKTDPRRQLLSIQFPGQGSGRVTSSPPAVDCTSECQEVFDHGVIVILDQTPEAGSTFAGWGGACAGLPTCVVSMDNFRTVTATFNPATFPLEVSVVGSGTVSSSPSGINCPVDCSETYAADEVVTLTASPGPNNEFVSWNGDCSGSGACVVTLDRMRSVSAEFAPVEYPLSVSVTQAGSGTVSSQPVGISCPADCTESFISGQQVTLTADPAQGYRFASWSGACTGTQTCTVTMDGARTVTADFEPDSFVLSVTVSGPTGNRIVSMPAGIDCPGNCEFVADPGASIRLMPELPSASPFLQWSGDCEGSGACTVIMNEDRTVTATFAQNDLVFVSGFEAETE